MRIIVRIGGLTGSTHRRADAILNTRFAFYAKNPEIVFGESRPISKKSSGKGAKNKNAAHPRRDAIINVIARNALFLSPLE